MDTFKQLGFTGPDGKPDQARMQEHILRCVWDLSQGQNHRPLRKVAEFRARAIVHFFGRFTLPFIGGEEIGDLGSSGPQVAASSCRG
jgi:hypothetical protein